MEPSKDRDEIVSKGLALALPLNECVRVATHDWGNDTDRLLAYGVALKVLYDMVEALIGDRGLELNVHVEIKREP